ERAERGGVDEQVHDRRGGEGLGAEPLDLGRLGEVAGVEAELASRALERRRELVRARLVAAIPRVHVRAGAHERGGGGAAEAARAAGDDGGATGEATRAHACAPVEGSASTVEASAVAATTQRSATRVAGLPAS